MPTAFGTFGFASPHKPTHGQSQKSQTANALLSVMFQSNFWGCKWFFNHKKILSLRQRFKRLNEKSNRYIINVPLPDTRYWGNGIGSLLWRQDYFGFV